MNLTILREQELIDIIFAITENRGFIVGGFARYCLSESRGEIAPYGDIDISCKDRDEFNEIKKRFDVISSEEPYESDNAVCYKILKGSVKVHLLKNKIGKVHDVLQMFDFTVCQFAITSDKKGICTYSAAHDERSKRLQFVQYNTDIFETLKRCFKYVGKGYKLYYEDMYNMLQHYNIPLKEMNEYFKEYEW